MKVSIIVSAYNRSGLFKNCLSGFVNQGVSNNLHETTVFKGKMLILYG